MNTIIFLTLIFVAFSFSQDRAQTETWLVDKAYTNKTVYKVGVGKNIHEAFAQSLSLLAAELQAAEQDIQQESSAVNKIVSNYSFGKTSIQHLRKNYFESFEHKDSSRYNTTITYTVKIQFDDGKRKAVMKYFDELVEQTFSEIYSANSHSSKSNREQTLSYEFEGMIFDDLLKELKKEGVDFHFISQQENTFALVTYPLSKVRK